MNQTFIRCLPLIAFLFSLHVAAQQNIDLSDASQWAPLYHVGEFQPLDEGFSFRCTDADPYIHTQALSASSENYKAIRIRLSASAGSQLQVFWSSSDTKGYSEPFSARVEIKPDGKPHEYVISLAAHPKWTGTITRLRLDPSDTACEATLHSFEIIDRIGPRIEMVRLSPSAPFANVGEELTVRARLKNSGDQQGAASLQLHCPEGVTLVGRKAQTIAVDPNQEMSAEWKVTSTQNLAATLRCEMKQGQVLNTVARWFNSDSGQSHIIEGGGWRALFVQSNGGVEAIEFQASVNHKKRSAAWSPLLGMVKVVNDKVHSTYPIHGVGPVVVSDDHLRLETTWRGGDGVDWRYQLDARRLAAPDVLQFDVALQGDGGRLTYLSGPELYLGERSFGREKDLAVFPGVEYLDRDAVSSSDAVARPPVRDHYRPHPFKVTIPLMALTQDDLLISLLWPPTFSWGRGQHTLSPTFAAPNRFDNQDNHRFGVFAPSVPDYVLENGDAAHEPYVIQPGETVRLQYAVSIDESDDPMDAVDVWTDLYQRGELPEPMKPPRSYEDTIRVSRQAYMDTCWDVEKNGWGHCVGWAAHPSGGMLALLDFDRFLTGDGDPALARRIKRVKNHIVDTQGEAGLANPAGCHVMIEEAAFYWGVVGDVLPNWRRQACSLMAGQNPDGSWGFNPTKPEQQDLGKQGEVVSGTIAPNAMRLLRYARITGDAKAAHAGFKALDALNSLRAPRGSQGWECPLAAADIMVCGYAARANLDAYQITSNRGYLDQAAYWARAGLAFHYLWDLKGRPLQRYATIPIFGTTFFTHSWRGVPVQWCGLVYSYALQELAHYDDRYDWRRAAEGIINSAIWQQLTDGPYAGTLPDSYGDYFITARGAYINPENIMTNLHMLQGNSLNIDTKFVGRPAPDGLRVSANATIESVKKQGRQFEFSLASNPERTTSVMISNLGDEVKGVQQNGEPIEFEIDDNHLVIITKQQTMVDQIKLILQ